MIQAQKVGERCRRGRDAVQVTESGFPPSEGDVKLNHAKPRCTCSSALEQLNVWMSSLEVVKLSRSPTNSVHDIVAASRAVPIRQQMQRGKAKQTSEPIAIACTSLTAVQTGLASLSSLSV